MLMALANVNHNGGFTVDFLSLIIGAAILLAIGLWLFVLKQGDAEFAFLTKSRNPFTVQEISADRVVLVTQVPFVNRGTQAGTIVDVFPRYLLPYEYFDTVNVAAKITIASRPRRDEYWEAIIVEPGKGDAIILSVTLTAKDGDIVGSLREMVDMPVDIMYQIVSRCNLSLYKERLILTSEEVAAALAEVSVKGGVAK